MRGHQLAVEVPQVVGDPSLGVLTQILPFTTDCLCLRYTPCSGDAAEEEEGEATVGPARLDAGTRLRLTLCLHAAARALCFLRQGGSGAGGAGAGGDGHPARQLLRQQDTRTAVQDVLKALEVG